MAEQDQDRSEEATPHKREEARKKGTLPRSQDVMSAGATGILLLVMLVSGPAMIRDVLAIMVSIWSHAGDIPFSVELLASWLSAMAVSLFRALAPLWVGLVLIAILLGMAQSGVIFTVEPLKPDLKRLNPVEGFKRLFTLKVLFEALKSTVKFIVFCLVVYYAIRGLLPHWVLLPLSDTRLVARAMGGGVMIVVERLFIAMLIVAAIDWLFVKKTLNKKLRMSRREVRDEVKRRDGDPRIKSKLREIRLQLLKKTQSLSRVADADVLVVNPQHLALAIQYRRGEMAAPLLIAKGAGDIALRMRELARRHGVPIMMDKPLARALFREVNVDEWIPDNHYAAVAKALVWAFKIKGQSIRAG